MWEISQNRRLLVGEGASGQAGIVLKTLRASRALILAYDADAEPVRLIAESVQTSGIHFLIDDSIKTEPVLEDIDRLVNIARANCVDSVVAVGGGSMLDAAKAVAMIYNNGGLMEEYQLGVRAIEHHALPILAIPTTAGTGSEATRVSVVFNPVIRLKKSIYSPYMIADAVILDAGLTVSAPASLTVSTGIDALSHAIESYVSLDATPYSEMFSMKAIDLIARSFLKCVEDGGSVEARGDMLLASYFAGCALSAGIGLAHIIAQPIGGLLKIPHGVACAIYLPYAMEYNLENSLHKYCAVARRLGAVGEDGPQLAGEGLIRVKELLKKVNAPQSIRAYLPAKFDLEDAVDMIVEGTGHIKCNPRPVTREVLLDVVKSSM